MQNRNLGLALMVAAMLTIPMVDGIAKYLGATHSPLFVSWARYAASCLFILPIALFKHGKDFLPKRDRGAHFLRTLFLVASMTLFFTALVSTPMANAISAFFVGPAVATVIAVAFFGEKISWTKTLALGFGFIGVLVIVRPGGDVSPGILLAVASGALFGVYLVATRIASSKSDPIKTLTFQAFVGSILLTPVAIIGWQWPDQNVWGLFLAMGALSAVTHILSITAFRFAETSLLAPLVYLEIVGAIIIGYLVFGDIPDWYVWLGAAMIVTSGILLSRDRENQGD